MDLATFFPRIDREALTVAEVLIGLPPEVIDLVGKIYGAGRAVAAEAVECQFDSAVGLSATFRNHMGALMGEVLSPDRAKIMLNSILWAIKLHVHGVALFGFGEDEEGVIRAIASLAYADDWAGTFSSAADLQRAWSIWSVWVPISGSKLGIKLKLKTVITGVLRDESGAESGRQRKPRVHRPVPGEPSTLLQPKSTCNQPVRCGSHHVHDELHVLRHQRDLPPLGNELRVAGERLREEHRLENGKRRRTRD